jgi:hypothetical protein
VQPFFQVRPLATIYRESVSLGFRPYYFCDDEERFALTFLKRQDVPLRLTAMPDDQRMIGLSYVGGLSRDTTAILCEYRDQPVIVFVDDRIKDTPSIAMADIGPGLYVHRAELAGLVLYEVSPFESPLFIEFLQVR